MISEIIHEVYDISGKKVTKPTSKKHKWLFPSTYPMGRYLSKPLTVNCRNIEDMRQFLLKCSYISDQEQFNKEDYWMPPEEFEKRLQGDCDDFSIWAWRQLIEMGYTTRFVIGRSGKYGECHAWVTYQSSSKYFLLEPLLHVIKKMPKLSTVRYKPKFSCEWDGNKISYYVHDDLPFNITFPKLAVLTIEWVLFWSCFWAKHVFLFIISVPFFIGKRIVQLINNKRKKHIRKAD